MDSDQIAKRVHCCGCRGKIGRVNLVEMDYQATWKFPTSGNVLTGDQGRAVAICCDTCAEASRIEEVVEFNGDQVIYHPLSELTRLPPPPTYLLVEGRGRTGIRCLCCGATSWHPEDVKNRYCARCERFHEAGILTL